MLTNNNPPAAVDVLAPMFDGHKSKHIPERPFDAAHWWTDHQEPANEYNERLEPITKNGELIGWKTPYHDKLVSTLRIFLTLSEPHKAFVIDNIQSGIPWRGDDIKFYTGVCAEAEKMAQDREGYISNAMSDLKNFKFSDVV